MNKDLGNIITAIVTESNETNTFVQKNGLTYKLISENKNVELGETINGFAYINKNDKLSFVTEVPEVRVDNFNWGTVVEVKKDLGVFVDIGLPDKDIVVSLDDLPTLKHLWPKKGDRLYINLEVDEKDRIWGKLPSESVFESKAHKASETQQNNDINGIVYSLHKSGSYFYTSDNYIAFVHPSERDREPRLGESVEGRVVGLREDGVLYASLKPRAHEILDDDAQMIYTVLLQSSTDTIPFTDKSKPEEIKNYFGISKSQFKRAIGRLMKKGLVEQTSAETKLIEKK